MLKLVFILCGQPHMVIRKAQEKNKPSDSENTICAFPALQASFSQVRHCHFEDPSSFSGITTWQGFLILGAQFLKMSSACPVTEKDVCLKNTCVAIKLTQFFTFGVSCDADERTVFAHQMLEPDVFKILVVAFDQLRVRQLSSAILLPRIAMEALQTGD